MTARKMRRMWRNPVYRALVLYLFVVFAAVVIMFQMNERTKHTLLAQAHAIEEQQERLALEVKARCHVSNEGRAEVNRRGDITKEFLLTAAEARRATALASNEAWERITNANTAKRYHILAARIKPLEYHDCDLNGEPDRP